MHETCNSSVSLHLKNYLRNVMALHLSVCLTCEGDVKGFLNWLNCMRCLVVWYFDITRIRNNKIVDSSISICLLFTLLINIIYLTALLNMSGKSWIIHIHIYIYIIFKWRQLVFNAFLYYDWKHGVRLKKILSTDRKWIVHLYCNKEFKVSFYPTIISLKSV